MLTDKSPKKANNNHPIEIIQILRLIAALSVIVFHSQIIGNHGQYGVDLMFIISGYIAVFSTANIEQRPNFLRRRLIRIIPLYWILTIFNYLLIYYFPQLSIMSVATPEYLIKSLFFIPFINSKGYDVPILIVGWTLNYEMFFYLIFTIAQKISHKYRAQITMTILLVLIIIGCFVNNPFIVDYYTSSTLFEFILGIGAYFIINKLKIKTKSQKNNRLTNGIFIILLVISIMWLVFDIGSSSTTSRTIHMGIPAFILFVSCVKLWQQTHFPSIIVKLGDISYSVYLFEYFTTAFYKVIIVGANNIIKLIYLLITIILTFAISYFSYLLIEVKLSKWLKNKILS